jgi:hypothetical protein
LFRARMNFTCRSVVQPSRRMRRVGNAGEEEGGAESWVRIRQREAGEILIGKGVWLGFTRGRARDFAGPLDAMHL